MDVFKAFLGIISILQMCKGESSYEADEFQNGILASLYNSPQFEGLSKVTQGDGNDFYRLQSEQFETENTGGEELDETKSYLGSNTETTEQKLYPYYGTTKTDKPKIQEEIYQDGPTYSGSKAPRLQNKYSALFDSETEEHLPHYVTYNELKYLVKYLSAELTRNIIQGLESKIQCNREEELNKSNSKNNNIIVLDSSKEFIPQSYNKNDEYFNPDTKTIKSEYTTERPKEKEVQNQYTPKLIKDENLHDNEPKYLDPSGTSGNRNFWTTDSEQPRLLTKRDFSNVLSEDKKPIAEKAQYFKQNVSPEKETGRRLLKTDINDERLDEPFDIHDYYTASRSFDGKNSWIPLDQHYASGSKSLGGRYLRQPYRPIHNHYYGQDSMSSEDRPSRAPYRPVSRSSEAGNLDGSPPPPNAENKHSKILLRFMGVKSDNLGSNTTLSLDENATQRNTDKDAAQKDTDKGQPDNVKNPPVIAHRFFLDNEDDSEFSETDGERIGAREYYPRPKYVSPWLSLSSSGKHLKTDLAFAVPKVEPRAKLGIKKGSLRHTAFPKVPRFYIPREYHALKRYLRKVLARLAQTLEDDYDSEELE